MGWVRPYNAIYGREFPYENLNKLFDSFFCSGEKVWQLKSEIPEDILDLEKFYEDASSLGIPNFPNVCAEKF